MIRPCDARDLDARSQGTGVGSALMRSLLVGTWAAAHWAIAARQRDTSVVLAHGVQAGR